VPLSCGENLSLRLQCVYAGRVCEETIAYVKSNVKSTKLFVRNVVDVSFRAILVLSEVEGLLL